MAGNKVRVGNVEITSLSDGILEFDLCNFFPNHKSDEEWRSYRQHLVEGRKVRFNLASYLIRSEGRTLLVDTGMGARPADVPETPWGELMNDFQTHGLRTDEVDMVVMTHLHRDHVGWNLAPPQADGGNYVPTFPRARYWLSSKDWEACHDPGGYAHPLLRCCHHCLAAAGTGAGRVHGQRMRLDQRGDCLPHAGAHPGPHEHHGELPGRAGHHPRRRHPQPGTGQ